VSCGSAAFSRACAGDGGDGAALLSTRMQEELLAVTPADLLQVMQMMSRCFFQGKQCVDVPGSCRKQEERQTPNHNTRKDPPHCAGASEWLLAAAHRAPRRRHCQRLRWLRRVHNRLLRRAGRGWSSRRPSRRTAARRPCSWRSWRRGSRMHSRRRWTLLRCSWPRTPSGCRCGAQPATVNTPTLPRTANGQVAAVNGPCQETQCGLM
jgi:hypothetical protein